MNVQMHRRLWLPIIAALLAMVASGCSTEDPIAASCGAKLIFGDLVISEVMANPTGKDDGQEWIEIYNATSAAVNVKGVKITLSKLDGSGDKTWRMPELTIEAGGFLVVGNADDATRPSFMHVGYDNKLSDMLNAGTKFVVKCGATEVDVAEVGEATEAVSLQLSSMNMDASANDKAENWCPATTDNKSPAPDLWANFKGTPGKANRPCAVPGKCMDGGEARDLVKPKVGDLLINEVMFDPDGTESEREWLEVMANGDFDLNDIDLGKAKNGVPLASVYTVTSADCLTVKKGDIVVLAREPEKHLNGGLPDGSINYDSPAMTNSSGHGVWIGIGGLLLDKVTWKASKNGHSLARDPGQADVWCVATENEPYGWAGDLYGTPAKANPPCP